MTPFAPRTPFQITASVSWGLEVDMPEPFSSFLNFLAVFSMNISLECYSGHNFFQGVYLSAAAPFVLAMFLSLASFAANLGAGGGE